MKINQKFLLKGMSCAACVNNITRAVSRVKGVKEVNVNLLTNSMVVTHDDVESDIIKAVKDIGYEAYLSSNNKLEINKDNDTKNKLIRLIISFILLIPLFYLSMGFMSNWPIGFFRDNLVILSYTLMVISLMIMIINYHFFFNGVKALFHKSFNMDTLVMLGSGVAFIYSLVLTIKLTIAFINKEDITHLEMIMMNISFETAGMVVTFISIGKLLESYSKGKTTNALKSLINLKPKIAHLIKDDKEIDVDINDLNINDIVKVYPGESIPSDGIIIKGNSSIDESMLTGESLPIDKKIDDEVKIATINNDGTLLIKVNKIGDESTLNKMIKMVENAANTKTKISSIADKVAGIFVPIVILISLITFICWMIFGKEFLASHSDIHSNLLSYSIERAIAVLVVSCPCALGLATPVSIMVATGKGAKNGILFKNALTMEEVGKIKYLLLDKTGTITKGHPEVNEIISLNNNEKELLSVAFALEKDSKHPLSIAIKEYILNKDIDKYSTKDFKNILGKGVVAKSLDNNLLLGGNLKLLDEYKIDKSLILEKIDKLSKEGKTCLIFAKNKEILGIISISDHLKDDSKEAIDKIKSLGIVPIILTGDNKYASKYIGDKVGVNYIYSSLLPEDKNKILSILKNDNKVAMVGDGINDALSLTSADVGIAIGKGSDIAIDSASIVLMKSTLLDAYASIKLSKIAIRNIKENLFWAFIYNIIMIPIAAGVFSFLGLYKLAPWMGSLAMALSSLFVVTNALRINLYNIYKSNKNKDNVVLSDILTKEIDDYLLNKDKNKTMKKEILINGMMCEHCVNHVTKALNSLNGIEDVKVSLKDKNALISGDVSDKEIIDAITNAGYEVKEIKNV